MHLNTDRFEVSDPLEMEWVIMSHFMLVLELNVGSLEEYAVFSTEQSLQPFFFWCGFIITLVEFLIVPQNDCFEIVRPFPRSCPSTAGTRWLPRVTGTQPV